MQANLLPLGEVPGIVVEEVSDALTPLLGGPPETHHAVQPPRSAYDASRGQYDAELLTQFVRRTVRSGRTLAITTSDIFYDSRAFVFGLAELDGDAAIVSTHRLTRRSGGGEVTTDVAKARLRKEALHEFGHLLGQRHCSDERCVMAFSMGVDGIDDKGETFCRSCKPTRSSTADMGSRYRSVDRPRFTDGWFNRPKEP